MKKDTSDDYVLATGELHTVREFAEKAFEYVGTTIGWKEARGIVDEICTYKNDPSRVLVRIDPRYFRPTEVELLLGDPAKAKRKLGWVAKTSFEDLVKEMVEADVQMTKGTIPDHEAHQG